MYVYIIMGFTMKFNRIISLTLAGIISASALASCNTPEKNGSSITASAGAETYAAFLEERLGVMPDSLIIASGDDTAAYGVDTSSFIGNEGYTIRAKDGEVVILGKNEKGLDRAVRQFAKYGNNESYTYTYGEDESTSLWATFKRRVRRWIDRH
jgi:hypothetical protein